MFKKDGENPGGETIIAKGVKLEGDFNSEGNVIVEGEVNGTITSSQDLRVGEEAKINANAKAQNAVVAGEINGNVKVTEKLELLASAKINGDVDTKVLSVTPGAVINGKVAMTNEVAVAAIEEKETPTRGRGRRSVKSNEDEEDED